MKKDGYSNVKVLTAIAPQSVTGAGTVDGATIDLLGFNSCVFALNLGALNSIAATVVIEHSDASTFGGEEEAVADKWLLPASEQISGVAPEASLAFSEADNGKVGRIGYIGNKRYVRLTVVVASASGANLISASAVLEHPHRGPVAHQGFV